MVLSLSSSPGTHHRHFRHNTCRTSFCKPAWVDSQLVPCQAAVKGPPQSTRVNDAGSIIYDFEQGGVKKTVQGLGRLVQQGSFVHNSVFYRVLKRCMAQNDLDLGKQVHALAVHSGYESNEFLANHIMSMYASHGRLKEAMQVFTKVGLPSSYMWSTIILAHARHGDPMEAIRLYRQMRESAVKPDNHIFVAVIKACASAADLFSGKEVHADILRNGVRADIFVGNSLVDMYGKCGSLEGARRVFDMMPARDVVTWTAMIAGYAKHGMGQEALDLYARMQQEGMTPANHVTFVCLLQACASVGALDQGRELHGQIEERGLKDDVFVGSCLVDMYAKCGSLEDARKVFDNLRSKNMVTWTAMPAGYAQHGHGEEALALYSIMQAQSPWTVSRLCACCKHVPA